MNRVVAVLVALGCASPTCWSKPLDQQSKALLVCYGEVLKDDADYAMARDRVFTNCMEQHGFKFRLSDNACVEAPDGQYRPACWEEAQKIKPERKSKQ